MAAKVAEYVCMHNACVCVLVFLLGGIDVAIYDGDIVRVHL